MQGTANDGRPVAGTGAVARCHDCGRRQPGGPAPDRSGHFVLSACKAEGGLDSLNALEDQHGDLPAEFSYENRWGDMFFWFNGRVFTSHHKIGRGLHVLGAGMVVFLPDSWTPHLQ